MIVELPKFIKLSYIISKKSNCAINNNLAVKDNFRTLKAVGLKWDKSYSFM